MTAPSTPHKRIAAGAYDVLLEALAVVFWNKGPFERYVRSQLRETPELVALMPFGSTKRQVATALVDQLAEHEDRYQALTLALMHELAATDHFPNLELQEDSAALIAAAERAVSELRGVVGQYSDLLAAQERLAVEEAEADRRAERRHNSAQVHAELKQRFVDMYSMSDHQKRGRLFEGLLNELFAIHDLSPRQSFVLTNEQIDGAFTFSTDDYLLEAKWEQTPASREMVDVLAMKVQRKGKHTMGLFVAVSGFSRPAIDAHSDCGGALVFMDGADLYSILNEDTALPEVLERKRRHLGETGKPLLLVKDM